jgi:Ni,Fe-hydrogenase III small subunit/formate hydrogenlyase subunit 6/NADH:ubiquinone oxidoreductase subunit I
MFKAIAARLKQGHRTMKFPRGAPPAMGDRYRGRPEILAGRCEGNCAAGDRACADSCPTGAIGTAGALRLDLGKCISCGACVEACPAGAISFTKDYRMAVRSRADLVIEEEARAMVLAAALDKRMRRLFGHSLKLRQVSAGGCNACEADVNVLGTIGWDLGRFGIQFVASPRHADGLLITGPVTKNMALALEKTWIAMPEPKLVIAVGACAISGGPYIGHPEASNGADSALKADLYIPGCPPHPLTILDGLLRLLGRIKA